MEPQQHPQQHPHHPQQHPQHQRFLFSPMQQQLPPLFSHTSFDGYGVPPLGFQPQQQQQQQQQQAVF